MLPRFSARSSPCSMWLSLIPLAGLTVLLSGCATQALTAPPPSFGRRGAAAHGTRAHVRPSPTPLAPAPPSGASRRGPLAGIWTSTDGLSAPLAGSVTPPAPQPVRLLVRQHGPVLRGILEANGSRYEVVGAYSPRMRRVTLHWGAVGSTVAYSGTLGRAGLHLVGAWQGDGRVGALTFTHTSPIAHVDLPPDGTPIPTATPTLIAYLPPTPTLSPVPTVVLAHPEDMTGLWRIPGGLYQLGPGVDASITLHQRGAALSGVLTQGAGRYQVTGTYDPATRTIRFAVPLPSGDSVQVQVALTPDYRQGTGSEGGAGIDGGLALVRVGDLGSAALPPTPLPRAGSGTPLPTATLVVPPTPIPPGDVDATWTWTGTGPTDYLSAPPSLRLHRSGSTLHGVLTTTSGRFEVAGTYAGGQVVLQWAVPGRGVYRFEGGVAGDLRSMEGIWYGPEGDGGSGFARSTAAATAASPAPPGASPTPTAVPCVANGPGLSASWTVVGGLPTLGYGATTLVMHQQGARLSGTVQAGAAHYVVTGTYNRADGQVSLSWGSGADAVHITGTVSGDLGRIEGQFGDGRGDDGGLGLARRLC